MSKIFIIGSGSVNRLTSWTAADNRHTVCS